MRKIFFIFFFGFFLLFFLTTEASEIRIEKVGSHEAGVDERVEYVFFLDSKESLINAVEGHIRFPDFLRLEKLYSGGSIVSLWIEKPIEKTKGEIFFSGIIPGGYLGNGERLFSAVFLAEKEGDGFLFAEKMKFLLSDGAGTEASSKNTPIPVSVLRKTLFSEYIDKKDDVPPEIFFPSITKIGEIFGDKHVLVFHTQDKESGVLEYKVKEGGKDFVSAESPYILQDQRMRGDIYVKAIDMFGNERVAKVDLEKRNVDYGKNMLVIGIMIVLFLVVFFIRKKRTPL